MTSSRQRRGPPYVATHHFAPVGCNWRVAGHGAWPGAGGSQPDGRLGWVQQVSDRPEQVPAADTRYYGVGAFLLAATAVADLKLN